MFKNRRLINLKLRSDEGKPVKIIGDAAIASKGIREGKLVPLLIIDTSNRPDIEELVRVHEHLPPGDAEILWCQMRGSEGSICLMLRFIRPSEVTFILEFFIEHQGFLVDQMLRVGAVYIQPGRPGDRLVSTSDNPRIQVQKVTVPGTEGTGKGGCVD